MNSDQAGRPARHGQRWLPGEEETLLRLIDAGATPQEAALQLQRTAVAVIERLRELAVRPR